MGLEMDIKFKGYLNERLPNGNVGTTPCDKCGRIGYAYAKIYMHNSYILLCTSCLDNAARIICDTIVDDIKASIKKRGLKK